MKQRREYLCLKCEWIGNSDGELLKCPCCEADESDLCYVNVNDNQMVADPPQPA
jgi:hypothetical protein